MSISSKLKNFGMLEVLVLFSAMYVVGMLIWTAATRPAVEAKANEVIENHKLIVDLINSEINKCDSGNEDQTTIWGDPCKEEWIADNILNYIQYHMF